MTTCLERAHAILPEAQLLVRLDSGNDAAENIDRVRAEHADFLIKRNLRQESPAGWLELAKSEGTAEHPREGKTIYRGTTWRTPKAGHESERVVYQVVERTITAEGQILLIPEVEVTTYWTSLEVPAEAVLPWYPEHGTLEQYHSEYKTDLDLERLPSGKFATNQLILQLVCLMFTVLRIIGQATLDDPAVPLRRKATRRRLRTVIHNLITCAAQLIRHARRVRLRYMRRNPWGRVLQHLYATFT